MPERTPQGPTLAAELQACSTTAELILKCHSEDGANMYVRALCDRLTEVTMQLDAARTATDQLRGLLK